jgi:biopolymer transport protein ExbD
MSTGKRRFLDVWIVESNTVYREVPYEVVCDWLQQGRLLEDDMLRWSGQAEWFKVGGAPAFAAYLPRAQPLAVEDQAEVLERVEVDFSWKRPQDEEDEDVDMIPLIDISLVLLIFFIMTTTGVVVASSINTPEAINGLVTSNPDLLWIGIDLDTKKNNEPVYSLGWGDKAPESDQDRDIRSLPELLPRIRAALETKPGRVEVTVKAHKDIPSGVVRRLTVELERFGRVKISQKFTTVSEKN